MTGEEKILPPRPRWFVCTVESMPPTCRSTSWRSTRSSSAPIPTAATCSPTGCSMPGAVETMFMGADTIRPLLRRLVPASSSSRGRAFHACLYRARASCIVCRRVRPWWRFPRPKSIRLAELIRRHRAVRRGHGRLSPRTRNAQVGALPVGRGRLSGGDRCDRHGAQHGRRPCRLRVPGQIRRPRPRALEPSELAQIAGRAGRHMNDGTFGTADVSGRSTGNESPRSP